MTAFQRISAAPTIPELLRQDTERWLAWGRSALHQGIGGWGMRSRRVGAWGIGGLASRMLPLDLICRVRMEACLAGAAALLAAARLLNGCGLLGPGGAGTAFAGAERLTWAGLDAWHARQRGRRLATRPVSAQPVPAIQRRSARRVDHARGVSRR